MSFTSNYGLLNIPDQWNEYFSKYPNGYTILEAVINWAGQVNDMVGTLNSTTAYVNNFMTTFDTDLDTSVKNQLDAMQADGTLDTIITQALQTDLGDITTLTTTDKSSAVKAINEIDAQVPKLWTYINAKFPLHGLTALAGDGVADDTLALQAIINYASSNNLGVFIPQGDYKLTSLISIPSKLNIVGAGKLLTSLKFYDCDGLQANSNYITISNLAIYTNSTTKTGLAINAKYVTVTDIYFSGLATSDYWNIGLYLKGVWYSNFTNLTFIGGNVTNVFYGYGIYSDYSVNNSFRGIMGTYLDTGFKLTSVADPINGNFNEGWTISDCIIAACNNAFYAQHGNYFNLSNNVLDMITQYGIYLEGNNVGNGAFIGNWINITNGTATATAIKITNSNKNIINGNNLSGGVIGIEVDGWYTTISNNAITGFSDTGIHQYTGQQVTISGNTFANNTNYDIKCEGTYCSISNHVMGSKIKWLNNSVAIQPNTKIMFTHVFNTVGGASKEIVTIPFPNLPLFPSKPLATIDINGDNKIFGVYDYDSANSTTSQSEFLLYTYDSSVIPATTLRATITLSMDDSNLNTA